MTQFRDADLKTIERGVADAPRTVLLVHGLTGQRPWRRSWTLPRVFPAVPGGYSRRIYAGGELRER